MNLKEYTYFDDEQLYDLVLQDDFSKIEEFLGIYGIDSVDRDGQNFLMTCIVENKKDFVIKLLELGMDINAQRHDGYSALHFAVQEGYIDLVEILLDKKININLQDDWGNTPLWRGLMCGVDENIILKLLDNGADLYIKNESGVASIDLVEDDMQSVVQWIEKNK